MRISRIFTKQPLKQDQSITIEGQRAHYIKNVLRLSAGSKLVVFNGDGGEYEATLRDLSRNSIQIEVGDHHPISRTPAADITLALALIKRDAMDFAIQKATELGVREIVPIITEHTAVFRKNLPSRLPHWQEIAINACEQCGLNRLPCVNDIVNLPDWLGRAAGTRLVASQYAEPGYWPHVEESYSLLIGPEGGFSGEELRDITQAGFVGVNLGATILRAETAAISLISRVHANQMPRV